MNRIRTQCCSISRISNSFGRNDNFLAKTRKLSILQNSLGIFDIRQHFIRIIYKQPNVLKKLKKKLLKTIGGSGGVWKALDTSILFCFPQCFSMLYRINFTFSAKFYMSFNNPFNLNQSEILLLWYFNCW